MQGCLLWLKKSDISSTYVEKFKDASFIHTQDLNYCTYHYWGVNGNDELGLDVIFAHHLHLLLATDKVAKKKHTFFKVVL